MDGGLTTTRNNDIAEREVEALPTASVLCICRSMPRMDGYIVDHIFYQVEMSKTNTQFPKNCNDQK